MAFGKKKILAQQAPVLETRPEDEAAGAESLAAALREQDDGMGAGAGAGAVAVERQESAPSALEEIYETAAAGGLSSGIQVDREIHEAIYTGVISQINAEDISKLSRDDLMDMVAALVERVVAEKRLVISRSEQDHITRELLNDMMGFGPLDILLGDEKVNDILINGPGQVYVERRGKLELTDVRFRDSQHLRNIAQRIAILAGRHVDESSPLADARLPDGSRVHIALPPVASNGPYVSIRKFGKQAVRLDSMVQNGSISKGMAKVLDIAAGCRLNLLVAGGTGAGKTTVLNALSQKIDPQQRVITMEDTLELQLQQPHVVRMECRFSNSEGAGAIDMRELLRNALRMRPDRIIVGEVRGAEVFDMLQAMNTGHNGSMATIHSNSPRDTLSRLESMVAQTGMSLPVSVIRQYIASALDMIIFVERMRDGVRRISSIAEVAGMEGNTIVTQPLFEYVFQSETAEGMLDGKFEPSGLKPRFFDRARYFGLDRELLAVLGMEDA